MRKEKIMRKYKMQICMIAAVALLGTAVFCGFKIYNHYAQVDKQTEAFEQIAEVVEQAPEEALPDDTPVSEGEDVLAKYNELYLQNEDMVGWISIAGTKVNYPIMQTPNNPDYYLKRNFDKEYSELGVPYIQENCDLATSDNLIIYGHHIKGGKMFGALEDYKSKSFYEEHKTIQCDTLTEQAEYEIVAVFKTVAYSSEGFRYYDFVNAENEKDFAAYIAKCKELALYDTGIEAKYGDRLITLSTCEYSAQNGRLVVVAKKMA
jgi:sortase B